MNRLINNARLLGAVFGLLLLSAFIAPAHAADKPVPHTLIALYSAKLIGGLENGPLHTLAEMPLNHLGLNLEYYNIDEKLPDLDGRDDVRGIVSWFPDGMGMKDPVTFLKWAEKAVKDGKIYVILGNPGFYYDWGGKDTPLGLVNHFMHKLGLHHDERWISVTRDVTYTYNTPSLFVGKDLFRWRKPPYEKMMILDPEIIPHLIAHKPGQADSVLIVNGPKGSYAADSYL
jgi:hypothetical protein